MGKRITLDLSEFFEPHPAQAHILKSKAKWIFVHCGRRFGKGRGAVNWLVDKYLELLEKPRPASLVPPIQIWVMAPSVSAGGVADQVWMEIKQFMPKPLVKRVIDSEYTMILRGGGVLNVVSSDKRAVHQALGLDILWITEADKMEQEVWLDVVPMLRSPYRAGYAYVESARVCPWFSKLLEQGMKPNKQIESFRFTSYTNPHIKWEDLDWDRDNTMDDATFRKTYMAEDSGIPEAAFPRWKLRVQGDYYEETPPKATHIYQIGVDLGKEASWTVISVFDLVTREIVYIDRYQTSWEDTRKNIGEVGRRYLHSPVYVDATGKGEPVFEELEKEFDDLTFIPVKFDAKTRYQLLAQLALAIERGTIRYPAYQPLMNELSWMKRFSKHPFDAFEVPRHKSDDCIFSIALAYSSDEVDSLDIPHATSRMGYGRPKLRR